MTHLLQLQFGVEPDVGPFQWSMGCLGFQHCRHLGEKANQVHWNRAKVGFDFPEYCHGSKMSKAAPVYCLST